MSTKQTLLLSRNFARTKQAKIDVAMKHGAYSMLKKAMKMKPEEVTAIVRESGLRGTAARGSVPVSSGDSFPRINSLAMSASIQTNPSQEPVKID